VRYTRGPRGSLSPELGSATLSALQPAIPSGESLSSSKCAKGRLSRSLLALGGPRAVVLGRRPHSSVAAHPSRALNEHSLEKKRGKEMTTKAGEEAKAEGAKRTCVSSVNLVWEPH